MSQAQKLSMSNEPGQYTLWQILGIWLAGGAPMALLGWVAYPAMNTSLLPVDTALLRINLLTVGLIWEFVLAMMILYREEGNIRLSKIRRRFGFTTQPQLKLERQGKPYGGGSTL